MDLWSFTFIQLCGWRYHPGFTREGAKTPSLEDLARDADEIVRMIEEKEKLWPSSDSVPR